MRMMKWDYVDRAKAGALVFTRRKQELPPIGGTYTNGDLSIAAGVGTGDNYWGWNVAGMDTRTGYGGGYGRTYYGGATVMGHPFEPQTVGNWTFYFNHNSFTFQDDAGYKGIGGDGKDRQRTFAAELTLGKFSVGSYIYTNDGNKESKKIDSNNPTDLNATAPLLGKNKKGAWKNGRVYFAPLWAGYRQGNQVTRIGFSNKMVQNFTQNLLHKIAFSTPYFLNYDEFNPNGWGYVYSGYYNPLTLWGR